MGEVLQRSADTRCRKPAADLRHHDGPAETAAVQEGGTGGAVDHIRPQTTPEPAETAAVQEGTTGVAVDHLLPGEDSSWC